MSRDIEILLRDRAEGAQSVDGLAPPVQVRRRGDRRRTARRGCTVAAAALVVMGAAVGVGNLPSNESVSATSSASPIPADTSPSGLAASTLRWKFLDELRNAAAANPDRYGGVATSGDKNIKLCDNGSGADTAVDTPVSELRASGATVRLTTCARTLRDLNKTLAEVSTSSVFSSYKVIELGWGIDYDRNTVEIRVDRIPPGFADKVGALWGDAVYLIVSQRANLQ